MKKRLLLKFIEISVKGTLLEAKYRSCGWTKGPARIYWWDDDVSSNVSKTSKEKYLEVKKKGRRAVYHAKC